MHAYVFWHWKIDTLAREEYEARQRAFHAALESAPPPGFLGSTSHALSEAAWTASDDAYEDWYRVQDSAALDALNAGAISASRQAPHDEAAAGAAGGTAGIYTLQSGSVLEQPAFACWFEKPAGMRYDELRERLGPYIESGGTLWMRFMVLGPSPEFCLQSTDPVMPPEPFRTTVLPLRAVWPR